MGLKRKAHNDLNLHLYFKRHSLRIEISMTIIFLSSIHMVSSINYYPLSLIYLFDSINNIKILLMHNYFFTALFY